MERKFISDKTCPCCETVYNKYDMFYDNYSQFHPDSKMIYCKDCCKTISNEMVLTKKNLEMGTRQMCQFFDVPFIPDAIEQFGEYVKIQRISMLQKGKIGKDSDCLKAYLDILYKLRIDKRYWEDLTGLTYFGMDILKIIKPDEDGDVELLESLKKEWGVQKRLEDYIFLVDRFSEYAQGQHLTPASKNTIRYLCLAELEVKQLKAINEDTSKLEEKISKYYKSLKLDNFNFAGDKPLYEKLIEDWAIIEETKEPLEWADEHLEDICGFKADNDEIMRCIGNVALGDKNYPQLTQEDIDRLTGKVNRNKKKSKVKKK